MRSWSAVLAGSDRQADHRIGHEDAFERVIQFLAAEGVAAGAIDGQEGDDVARAGLGDILAVVGVHADDAADAERLIGAGVAAYCWPLARRALVDADVAELAEGLIDDLETPWRRAAAPDRRPAGSRRLRCRGRGRRRRGRAGWAGNRRRRRAAAGCPCS